MKKAIVKTISAALIATSVLTANMSAYAADTQNTDGQQIESEVIQSNELKNLETEKYMFTDVLSCDTIDNEDLNTAKELVDNGTSLYITNENINTLSDLFNEEYSQFDNSDLYLGTYIQSNGDGYTLTPITADIVESEDCSDCSDTVYAKEINQDIDLSDVYNKLQNDTSDNEILNKISETEKAKLQTSTAIGNSFADCSVFKYFYKKGSVNGTGTTYQYSSAGSISNWSKLGSIKILGYAIKVKTVGNKTYDNIYSVVTASGLNNKFVHYYNYNMKVTSSNTSILDETYLKDGSSKVTTSIASGVSSDGKGTITSSTSYSYDPNGQQITNKLGEKSVKSWYASPNSKVKNGSWKISPSMLVVNNNGKNATTSVKFYVNDFRVGGGTRHYTITSQASVTLSFKNHKKV